MPVLDEITFSSNLEPCTRFPPSLLQRADACAFETDETDSRYKRRSAEGQLLDGRLAGPCKAREDGRSLLVCSLLGAAHRDKRHGAAAGRRWGSSPGKGGAWRRQSSTRLPLERNDCRRNTDEEDPEDEDYDDVMMKPTTTTMRTYMTMSMTMTMMRRRERERGN